MNEHKEHQTMTQASFITLLLYQVLCLSVSLVTICYHASAIIFPSLSRKALRKEEKKMSLLQAADQRAGEGVPVQRVRQQGQTYAAVSPSLSDGSVCVPSTTTFNQVTKPFFLLQK